MSQKVYTRLTILLAILVGAGASFIWNVTFFPWPSHASFSGGVPPGAGICECYCLGYDAEGIFFTTGVYPTNFSQTECNRIDKGREILGCTDGVDTGTLSCSWATF